ncbi:CaiF/GrlA family transcriptional regulator [Citrobacter sp. Cpo147]|uniref:CaiF/GrlA family transcriptional regulator n=1 Tax=Citrobacter sp. Cpo147 TaxID=2985152 RepID=UPI00257856B6|nr:CaiF/GrlA family transcriptional regulator [Citrobacter sp. Cpo147]MDM2770111.1 CaiF/GrlA family transcriptional regulator [Citrobacter sp. Cpo147]
MCPDNTHAKKQHIFPVDDIHYPSQTNHEICFIPECVRQYRGEPLYILVAHWCRLQKDWVQRNQIAEAFHITARRASYLISYLRNKAGRIDCEYRKSVLVNKVSHYEIRISTIREYPLKEKKRRARGPTITRMKVGNSDIIQAGELWNLLCKQRRVRHLLNRKKDVEGE